MKKKNIIFSVVGMIILFSGIIAGTLLVRKNQDFREKAAPATTLTLTSTNATVAPGEALYLDVLMNTGENSVTGVDIVINFDASAFSVTSIQQGSGISDFTSEIRNTYDNVAGSITYSAFTLDGTKAVNGSGIATLRVGVSVKDTANTGDYSFSFGGATAVSGTGEGVNVLVGTIPVSVTVEGGGIGGGVDLPTPTPTSPPVGAPTATPTSTPTVTSASSSDSSTPFPMPESGIGETTVMIGTFGIMAIIFSVMLLAI